MEDKFDDKEKLALKMSFDDIISENPRTQVAAKKIKLLLAKAGKETVKAVRDIAVDIASETAKKIILGE